jgi:oligopeptide transport system ATP-binding protein
MGNRAKEKPLLKVSDLKQHFKTRDGYTVKAVNGVSFEIYPGETYCLIGESGSGKSTVARSVIRLYAPTEGKIEFKGIDISGKLEKSTFNLLRTKMQMIFQDPMSSLNPRKKIFDAIAQGMDIHRMCENKRQRTEKVYDILERVGLSKEFSGRYPHQFSGGQRQRVGIARVLAMNPDLVIADEAISALDVSIQAQIVNLMNELKNRTGMAYLFIAHDLAMVKYLSDRIGVIHRGYLVESGSKDEIFGAPIHPYTRSLLSAIPHPNPILEKKRIIFSYDYESSGIDYEKGNMRFLSGDHYVLATHQELTEWSMSYF